MFAFQPNGKHTRVAGWLGLFQRDEWKTWTDAVKDELATVIRAIA
jgi:hypothetical protein